MKRSAFSFFQYIVLLVAFGLTIFLIVSPHDTVPSDTSVVFVVDVNRTMNTQDVTSGTLTISRLQAAKSLISTMIIRRPEYSYGLLLFGSGYEYIIPPTFDTGTLLLYLSGITTNILPAGPKNFAQLSGLLTDPHHAYIVFSDFDAQIPRLSFGPSVTLIGLGSRQGGVVRYSNGIQYYDQGASVSSIRNDTQAAHLDAPYIPLKSLDFSVIDSYVFSGSFLPRSLRMVLYGILGVLLLVALVV